MNDPLTNRARASRTAISGIDAARQSLAALSPRITSAPTESQP